MQEYVMTFFKCMIAAAPFIFVGLMIGIVALVARSIVKTILSIRRTRRIAEEYDTYEVADGETVNAGDLVSKTWDGKVKPFCVRPDVAEWNSALLRTKLNEEE